MAHLTPTQIHARGQRAWTLKRPWYGLLVQCWLYAAPGLDPYRTGAGWAEGLQQSHMPQGQPRHNHLFDATLARATMRHANRLVSEIFPSGRDWAEMNTGPFFGMGQEDQGLKEVMEVVQGKMFQAIHASNFNLASNMMTFDGVVSGTGCMKVGLSADSSTLLDFEAVNQSQVAFEAGPRGLVWGFYRKLSETREHIRVLWPEATLPKDMDADLDAAGRPKYWELMECTTYAPLEGQWHYDVLLKGTASDHYRIVERDYVVCPWIVWRYLQLPGEVQGRSPVMAALPDARTANHATRVRLESASMRVAGMFTYKGEDSFNPSTVHMRSGAFIQVGSNDPTNPTIRPLELAGDPQFGELVLEDVRASINETMLNVGLPEPTGAVRSATEIIERQRDNMRNLGQPYLRLAEEVGRPVLRAVAYMLAEAGHLEELAAIQPVMPNGAPMPLMLDGRDVAVQFTSPMVTAQQLSDAETIVRWAEMSQMVAGPQGYQSAVKTEEAPAVLAEKMGAPPELVRSEEERMALANDLREAQMAAAEPSPAPGAPMQ